MIATKVTLKIPFTSFLPNDPYIKGSCVDLKIFSQDPAQGSDKKNPEPDPTESIVKKKFVYIKNKMFF